MTREELVKLKKQVEAFYKEEIEIVETHISFVLLTSQYAFKIKKPIKTSFLDFSTLHLRKHFCEQELLLNKRLAPEVYLEVKSLQKVGDSYILGENVGEVVDYILVMKRIDNSKEMDKLLEKETVKQEQVEALAEKVAEFHVNTASVNHQFSQSEYEAIYNDVSTIKDFVSDYLGTPYKEIIEQACESSTNFLATYGWIIQERNDKGFIKDCHGDMHSKNIFLTTPPVIFDCIEFDDTLRHIDVLDELAFLCMDLEKYHAQYLAEKFIDRYRKEAPDYFSVTKENKLLFTYFKSHRANVRAKVMTIQAQGLSKQSDKQKQLMKDVGLYLQLTSHYTQDIKSQFNQF